MYFIFHYEMLENHNCFKGRFSFRAKISKGLENKSLVTQEI